MPPTTRASTRMKTEASLAKQANHVPRRARGPAKARATASKGPGPNQATTEKGLAAIAKPAEGGKKRHREDEDDDDADHARPVKDSKRARHTLQGITTPSPL